MPKQMVDTPSAPPAMGPYSVAVEAAGLVFVSGQVAIDPATGQRAADEIEAESHQVLDNIGAILSDQALDYSDVVKTTIFLQDIADFPVVNDIYRGYFSQDPPARSTVQVAGLPGGYLIEIEVIAARR